MIYGKIEITYRAQRCVIEFDNQVTKILMDDSFFLKLFEERGLLVSDIDRSIVRLTITSERDTLIIEELTLFDQVVLQSFNDTKASYGLLVVNGVKVEIISTFIDILRTNSEWVLIRRSLIRSYDYSLKECEMCIVENNPLKAGDSLLLNYVTIEKLTIYKSIDTIEIKSAKIDRFEIDTMLENTFDFINITWNTYIEELSVAGDIRRLRIKNSIINKLNFKKTKIETVDNKKSDINMVFMLDTQKIVNKNQSAWELLFKSAINDDNDLLYAKAGYEINDLRHKGQTKFSRLSGELLKITIGYGYRPYRAIMFSIVAISLFALVYMGLDYILLYNESGYSSLSEGLSHYFDMWYLSGTAYTTTGFGDIVPSNAVTKVMAIFEAMIGVSVLSLFMYSLLNRYGKK